MGSLRKEVGPWDLRHQHPCRILERRGIPTSRGQPVRNRLRQLREVVRVSGESLLARCRWASTRVSATFADRLAWSGAGSVDVVGVAQAHRKHRRRRDSAQNCHLINHHPFGWREAVQTFGWLLQVLDNPSYDEVHWRMTQKVFRWVVDSPFQSSGLACAGAVSCHPHLPSRDHSQLEGTRFDCHHQTWAPDSLAAEVLLRLLPCWLRNPERWD